MGTILFILFLIFLFYYVLRPILRVSFTFRNMKREFEDSMRQQREQYEQAYRNQTSPNGYNGHRQKIFDSTANMSILRKQSSLATLLMPTTNTPICPTTASPTCRSKK